MAAVCPTPHGPSRGTRGHHAIPSPETRRLLKHRGAIAGEGVVLSLSADSLPLDRAAVNLPIGWL